MANILLVLPIILPLTAGACGLLLMHSPLAQRWIGVLGSAGSLLCGLALLHHVYHHGIVAVTMGNWPAPFGITLVADLFSAIMVTLTGLMAFTTNLYSLTAISPRRIAFGHFPLVNILVMGVCGAFLTGDLFNLYVWYEVMLIASFVLLVLGGEKPQLEGAVKYVTLNLIASILFLSAVGVLYGKVGTLNMADLAIKLREQPDPALTTAVAMMFIIAFGIKAALFPMYFWLPAAYHTPPIAITALFSGLLTKVGVYSLIRVFTLIFTDDREFIQSVILFIAGMTMLSGVLGAVAQYDFRRLLSFHVISQIGYMVMGLGLFTILGLAASIYFMVQHILIKASLFLVSDVAYHIRGTYDLKKLGNLYHNRPGLALLFLIPALALGGIPPLSGFFAKFSTVRAGLEVEHYVVCAAALLVSIMTLYSMTKIWNEAFWKPVPEDEAGRKRPEPPASLTNALQYPICILVGASVALGLGAEYAFQIALRAAEQLLDPAEYIAAVFGGPV